MVILFLPSSFTVSSHEIALAEATINCHFLRQHPERLIGDNTYDSNPLDARLKKHQIQLIALHKANRVNVTQDGRDLRRRLLVLLMHSKEL